MSTDFVKIKLISLFHDKKVYAPIIFFHFVFYVVLAFHFE